MSRAFWQLIGLLAVSAYSFAQPVATYQAGTTYYDEQYRAGGARLIDYDATGWVHVVWTNATNESHTTRHVYYNLWDPVSESFGIYPIGVQVDNRNRGGYASQVTTADGRCYPAFHQNYNAGGNASIGVAIDFIPQTGAFSSYRVLFSEERDCFFPRIAMDSVSQALHVVFSVSDDLIHYALYYVRAIPRISNAGTGDSIEFIDATPLFIDSLAIPAYDITTTQSRVAITWVKPRGHIGNQYDNDLAYIVSEDGGETFSPEVNITQFAEPDWECLSGDSMVCNRDTFRVHADVSTLFDEEGNLHAAFSTTNYYALQGHVADYAGQLWHWSEQYETFSPIRAVGEDYSTANWGESRWYNYDLVLQDPCLSLDRTTGDWFCTYSFSDTSQWSASGLPQADIWVSRSSDGGLSWSQGTNITMTNGGQNTPFGECLDESCPSAARFIRYQDMGPCLDIVYMLDLDAGVLAIGDNPGITSTLNPIYYSQVLVNSIPAEPIWDPSWPRLHVGNEDVSEQPNQIPNAFTLHQNYPNPFNPTTKIQFDLAKNMNVTLSVFNVLGQEVATLLNDKPLTAGVQVVEFDATNLPSGVYVYQMKAGGLTQSHKMVLLK